MDYTRLIKPILAGIKYLNNELSALSNNGVKDYLENQFQKYGYINSPLHGNKKVSFDRAYFPIRANYGELSTNFKGLHQIFDEYNFINIIGNAGTGKSYLLRFIFLNSIHEGFKIPVMVELKHLNTFHGTIYDLVFQKIQNNRIKSTRAIIKRYLERGAFLFLFDGFDEIHPENLRFRISDIEEFVDLYPKNSFLITSRPYLGVEHYSRFCNFSISELRDGEILQFIDEKVESESTRKRIHKIIEGRNYSEFKDYLKKPSLLSLFILGIEQSNAKRGQKFPNQKKAFYSSVFIGLVSEYDNSLNNDIARKKITNLSRDDFERILSELSYLSFIDGNYPYSESLIGEYLQKIKSKDEYLSLNIEYLIFDLTTSINIFIRDDNELRFPHRSMQEYFLALYIKNLRKNEKISAYKKTAKRLRNGYDNSFNLMELLKEIDPDSFLKFFLIPELRLLLNELRADDEVVLFDKFLDILTIRLTLNERHKDTNPLFYLSFGIITDFSYSLLFLAEVYFHAGLIHFLEKNDLLRNEILELIEVEDQKVINPRLVNFYGIKYVDFNNMNDVKSKLVEAGIGQLMRKLIYNLEQRLSQLEKKK